MGNVRRTQYAFFSLEDEYSFDAVTLLQGIEPVRATAAGIFAVALLSGERHPVGPREWEILRSIPIDAWVDEEEFDRCVIVDLLEKGLIVSDSGDGRFADLQARDEALTGTAWHPYAAFYHLGTQWSGVHIGDGTDGDGELAAQTADAVGELIAEYGTPPSEIPHLNSTETVALPGRDRPETFYRTLISRRTTRAFDGDRPMSLDDLDAILRYVFGCHGFAGTANRVVCIKRTSASGGGLHPVSPYPVISNVEGVTPGIYHYNAGDHSLALLKRLTQAEACDFATRSMCGQGYFGSAHVSFVLAARFYRSHWKYRRHPRAYAGILMDAAHLSQTLYLVAAELGLGAFVTIGINGRDIEERLGLDGIEEGVVAMCGCGPRSPRPSPLEPVFTARRPAAD